MTWRTPGCAIIHDLDIYKTGWCTSAGQIILLHFYPLALPFYVSPFFLFLMGWVLMVFKDQMADKKTAVSENDNSREHLRLLIPACRGLGNGLTR